MPAYYPGTRLMQRAAKRATKLVEKWRAAYPDEGIPGYHPIGEAYWHRFGDHTPYIPDYAWSM